MLKTRNRLVSFRLSEEEYQRLKFVCSQKGARSISDGARAILCQMRALTDDLNTEGGPAATSGHLIDSLERLNSGINRLTDLVERLKEEPQMVLSTSGGNPRTFDAAPQTNLKAQP